MPCPISQIAMQHEVSVSAVKKIYAEVKNLGYMLRAVGYVPPLAVEETEETEDTQEET